eukprot:113563-Amorphochlora_amoeboformis.AAC.1
MVYVDVQGALDALVDTAPPSAMSEPIVVDLFKWMDVCVVSAYDVCMCVYRGVVPPNLQRARWGVTNHHLEPVQPKSPRRKNGAIEREGRDKANVMDLERRRISTYQMLRLITLGESTFGPLRMLRPALVTTIHVSSTH